jgi:type I restriction enzyme, S subunit
MTVQKVALGEVCNFVRGVTFDGNEVINTPADGYVPILRAGNIGDELYIHDDLVWVPKKQVSKEQYFQVGDIAICMASGSPKVLGKTAQLKKSFFGSVGAFCGIIRPTKVDPNYIAYWLKSSDFMAWRDSQANGVNIQNLRPTEIQEIEIPLPRLTEQKRIASLLARADRMRQLRRTARDFGDALLQSVFLEMFGDPKINSKKWDMCIIGDIVEFSQYGTSDKSNSEKRGYPVLGMANITYEGRLDLERLSYVDLSEKEFSQLKLERGDVIFNRTNSTELVGKTTYWNQDFDAVIASYLVKLRLKKEVLPEFFVASLNMPHYKSMFQERCKKAVGQSNISPTLLKEFPVFAPPLSLQEEFAGMVAHVEGLQGRMSEAERQVEGLFESLLSESFEG